MGVHSCGPLCSRVPAFLDFSFAFRVPVRNFFRFPLCSRVLVLSSYDPVLSFNELICGGATHHTRAVCVWINQVGRVNSPPRHYPPPLVTRARCMSQPAGSQFEVKLVSRPQSPPSTSPFSTHHNCVISSQECKFSDSILSRSAFPRARDSKIPGTRERGNVKPGKRAHLW